MKKLAKIPGGSFRGTIPNLTEDQMRAIQNVQDFIENSPVNMDGTPKNPKPGPVGERIRRVRENLAALPGTVQEEYSKARQAAYPYIYGDKAYEDIADYIGAERDYNERDYQDYLKSRGRLNREDWNRENASPNPVSRGIYTGLGGSYNQDYADHLAANNTLNKRDWQEQRGTYGAPSTPKERIVRRLEDLGVEAADNEIRQRFNLRKGVPSTQALNELADTVPVEDILFGRHQPGVAPRDRYGNIMPATYPRRVEGRYSQDKHVLPMHERGIVPNSEFEGPPQPNIGLTPEFQKRLRELGDANSRVIRHPPSLPEASQDLFIGDRNQVYLPGVVRDDIEDRTKAFGPSLGFTSQSEFDDYYYRMTEDEMRRRKEISKDKDIDQLATAGRLAASAAMGYGLGNLAVNSPWLAAGLSAGNSLGPSAYRAGKDAIRDYVAYSGDDSLESMLDYENYDLPSRGGLTPTQALQQYVQMLQDNPSEEFKQRMAQLAYSSYEEGKHKEAYQRLRDLYRTRQGFDTAPSSTPDKSGYVDSSMRLIGDLARFDDSVQNLQRDRGKKKSPYTDGIKGLMYAGLSDAEAALIEKQMQGRDISFGDVAAVGGNLALRGIKEIPNFLWNNKADTLSALMPFGTTVGGTLAGLAPRTVAKAHGLARGIQQTRSTLHNLQRNPQRDINRVPSASNSATNLIVKPALGGLLSEAGRSVINNTRDTRTGDALNNAVDTLAAPRIHDAILESPILTKGREEYATPGDFTPGAKSYWGATKPARDSLRQAVSTLDSSIGTTGTAVGAYRMARPLVQPVVDEAITMAKDYYDTSKQDTKTQGALR